MSVYNGEAYLKYAIESLLNQTFKNFELLIIDDKSTDQSLNIIKQYANSDPRITLYKNNKNLGLTKSLNKILSKARATYIARMDADDISEPDRLAEQYKFIVRSNADVIWSNVRFIDERNRKICTRFQPRTSLVKLGLKLKTVNLVVHPMVLGKKQAMLDAGGYDERYRSGQDGELWLQMLKQGFKFATMPKIHGSYRIHSNNHSSINSNTDKRLRNYTFAKWALIQFDYSSFKHWHRRVSLTKHRIKLYLLLLGGNILVFIYSLFFNKWGATLDNK